MFERHKRWRRLLAGTGLSLAVGTVLSLLLWKPNLFSGWQLRITDFLYKPAQTSGQVVIVAIDDKSLDEMGRWESWSRLNHARLIDVLSEAGARVIGLDLIFPEPSPDDETLAAAMARAGNVIQPVLGTPSSSQKTERGHFMEFERLLKPQPVLIEASVGLGHANVYPDTQDGVVRRLPAVVESGDEWFPAFSLAVLAEFWRLPPVDYYVLGSDYIVLADRRIPVDDFGRILINYLGPPSKAGTDSTFPVYSYVDVMERRVDLSVFKNKMILVGVMASAMPDNYTIPLVGERMFGVEIHANVIETIYQRRFLHEQSLAGQIAAVLFLAIFSGAALSQFRPIWATLLAALILIVFWLWTTDRFDQGVIPNFLYPSLALLCTYIALLIYHYLSEERQRRQVTKLFGRYVTPQVASEVLSSFDAGTLQLGGVSREATVLFADIRGFSSLAEGLQPTEVVAMLNAYLSDLVAVIDKHKGTVNKYIGDNIMAIWNAPLDQPDHALRAVQAAIEMQQAVEEIRRSRADLAAIGFGIGINSGEMVAGNVGCENRMEYTVIGEAVNLASRLCDQAGEGEILTSSYTYALLQGQVEAEELPPVRFKGKRESILVYAVHVQGTANECGR